MLNAIHDLVTIFLNIQSDLEYVNSCFMIALILLKHMKGLLPLGHSIAHLEKTLPA